MEEDFEMLGDFPTDATEAVEDYVDESSEAKVVGSAASYVLERYNRAKNARRGEELRALTAYKNYRGVYEGFTKTEKSKVFIKVTKTKVLAAYGQIVDVLFGGNKFPLSIEPQRLPEGVLDSVHLETDPALASADIKDLTSQGSSSGDGEGPLMLGALGSSVTPEKLGPLAKKLSGQMDKLIEGPGTTNTSITFHPADVAAKKMEKKIQDQLEQCHANKHLRTMAFEMALYGTGVMKGPFAYDKEYPRWDDTGEYTPVFKTVPKVECVSFWDFYPDPDASRMEDAQYVVERHKMSRKDLRDLKNRPYFREEAIEEVICGGENYLLESWESEMTDYDQPGNVERFEVLEFWGLVDKELLEDEDIRVPKSLEGYETLNVNIWVCNGNVIRLVFNPFKPAHIPYYVVPYEVNPYSIFGVGLAENMEDSQTLMNGFMRMAVDNAALSGNLILEVDKSNLAPGQDLDVYPGKIFIRDEGAPGQAIYGTEFPNVSQQNMLLFDKARALADESTGFPSYAHGQTDIQGVGRTASGISMLMNAANGGIKAVVKNIDDYLLAPMGKALFSFNMQFDYDPEIKGDLEVLARGTESLMANEVRSQRLMQFLGVVSNPALMPFAKLDSIIREIAKSLDLDPDKVVNNLADAQLQAELIKQMNPQPPTGAGAPIGAPSAPAGTDPSDPTGAGGGTIGVGMAPNPGDPGFSANGNTGKGTMEK